jgi:site-specific DNA recombinase
VSDDGMSSSPLKPLRGALYARVSSQQQAEANTIASQVAALRARIGSDGLTLDEELCFLDAGYSGGTLFRPALERLRDQAAAGVFDRLYVHSPDRLARAYPYQFLLVEELQRHGVEIVFLNRDIGKSPEDNLLLQMQGMMAEYERAKILERSRRGKRHAAQAGVVNVLGQAPFGYRYISKYEGNGQARYEIDEARAEIVRKIFTWVAVERCSIGAVCRRLQQQNIHSPRGKDYWDRSTVWGILNNSAYRGEAQFGKTRVGPLRPRLRAQRGRPLQPRDAHSTYDTPLSDRVAISVPALVDEALFASVAEQLAENRRRQREGQRGARYLLQGLLVCEQCGYAYYGKPLSRSARKGKPRHYAYYRCVGTDAYRFGGQAVCHNPQYRTDTLDKAVWDDARALLAEPERVRLEYERRLRDKRKKSNRPTEQVEKLLAKVRRGISRLIDAYQDGYLDKTEFEPRIQGLKERLAQLEAEAEATAKEDEEQANLRAMIEHVELFAERIRGGLEEANWQTRRDILRALIKQVEVGVEGIRIVYKVPAGPFEGGPDRGRSQDCGRRDQSAAGEHLPQPAGPPDGRSWLRHDPLCRRLRGAVSNARGSGPSLDTGAAMGGGQRPDAASDQDEDRGRTDRGVCLLRLRVSRPASTAASEEPGQGQRLDSGDDAPHQRAQPGMDHQAAQRHAAGMVWVLPPLHLDRLHDFGRLASRPSAEHPSQARGSHRPGSRDGPSALAQRVLRESGAIQSARSPATP